MAITESRADFLGAEPGRRTSQEKEKLWSTEVETDLAAAAGVAAYFADRAARDAGFAALSDGDQYEIASDSDYSGGRVLYRKVAGAEVFVAQLPSAADIAAINKKISGWIDVSDLGWAAGTPIGRTAIEEAAALSISTGKPLKFPAGQFEFNEGTFISIAPGKIFRMFSDGGTEIYINRSNGSGMHVEAEMTVLTQTISRNISIGQNYFDLSSIGDIVAGDLILLYTTSAVESGWGYKKNCIRKVSKVDGNRCYVDAPFDFFFTVAEMDFIHRFKPATFISDNISYRFNADTSGGSTFVIKRGLNGLVSRATVQSPERKWLANGFSDGIVLSYTDHFGFNECFFKNLRYAAFAFASRNTRVTNFRAEGIRHLDANTWSENLLYENGECFDTDGVVQSHPCIRPTFRNVRDGITGATIYGLDLRGMGETVEDCTVTSVQTGYSTNTNAPLLYSEYNDMAARYTRTLRRVKSDWGGIEAGKEGTLIVEACDVGFIEEVKSNSNPDVRIIIDDATRISRPFNRRNSAAFTNVVMSKNVGIDLIPAYATTPGAANTAISAISLANPGIVTAAGHGLTNGNIVWISGVVGMQNGENESGINHQYYKVASATSDTFALNSMTDEGVDTSGLTAYTSGGVVTEQDLVDCLDAATKPNVGIMDGLKISSRLYEAVSYGGSETYEKRMIYRALKPGSVSQKFRGGRMTIRAHTRSNGYAEAVYNYGYAALNYGLSYMEIADSTTLNGVAVSVANFSVHEAGSVINEGDVSSNEYLSSRVNERYYCEMSVNVSGLSSTRYLRRLEVFFEEEEV